VRRLQDPDDRRRVLVQLTETGLERIERATAARFETASAALACLGPNQRLQLSGLLRRLLLAQDEAR
jgi:DNA-binding MarR family transcriptional regulator